MRVQVKYGNYYSIATSVRANYCQLRNVYTHRNNDFSAKSLLLTFYLSSKVQIQTISLIISNYFIRNERQLYDLCSSTKKLKIGKKYTKT